jgi:Cft2 family RNA processing exonuclease
MLEENLNTCKLNSPLEKSLSKLNKLKDQKILLLIDHIRILSEYRKKIISKEKFTILWKESLINIALLDGIIKDFERNKNNDVIKRARYVRDKNKRYNIKKINGIPIKTFRQLTRDMFNSKLPKECKMCLSKEKLTIHHIRYKYPIELKDLMRLCRNCHSKLHKSRRESP